MRGWGAWRELCEQRRRKLRLMQGVGARLMRPKLAESLATWRGKWELSERDRLKRAHHTRGAFAKQLRFSEIPLSSRSQLEKDAIHTVQTRLTSPPAPFVAAATTMVRPRGPIYCALRAPTPSGRTTVVIIKTVDWHT